MRNRHTCGSVALAKALKKRGWSQSDLADELGVHRSTVQRWLTGTRPDSVHRLLLEDLLGVPSDAWDQLGEAA